MRRAALAAALALAGCAPAQGEVAVSQLDDAFYAAHVQPFVGGACGSLDCHGVGMRPLRIYAEDGLRADGALRGMPITDEELAWNVAAFEAVDPVAPSPEQHIAVLKPLAVDAGGMHHLGDPIFLTEEDPGYRCLLGWIASDASPAVVDACAEATAALELQVPAP